MGKRAVGIEFIETFGIKVLALADKHSARLATTYADKPDLCSPSEWAALAVGWAKDAAPMFFRGIRKGRADGQQSKGMRSRSCWLRVAILDIRVYAAVFLTDFDCGLGAAFLILLDFSFAANSCLTFAAMASVSTLYTAAASFNTCAVC